MPSQEPQPARFRRRCLLAAGAAFGLSACGRSGRRARARAATRPAGPAAALRSDLLDASSPGGLEIIQLTAGDVPACHVYMEAQVFTPDSRRFVLHRSAHPHGSDRNDPKHQYLLCDLDDRFALHPLTHELGTTGPSVSPDGKYLYYFVDRTAADGTLTLKRVRLDGSDRQTMLVIDSYLPGTKFRPGRVYSLSSISSDGRKLAISACLDRTAEPVIYGLMVFDLRQPSVEVILHGPTWANVHPQFCRAADAMLKCDILVQENHGHRMSPAGTPLPSDDPHGVDIHVIRDDGTNFRNLPWGRDGTEFCEGHQCWRGQTDWAITSVGIRGQASLIEGRPVPHEAHHGLNSPGGVRNRLTRDVPNPQFHHFAVDRAGHYLITDYEKTTAAACIYLARLGEPGRDPLSGLTCLARPRPSGTKQSHMHPFLSPDATMAFFNSDETGTLQAYMIRNLPT